ncbi:helix-turn-helix domain-containing protein [Halobacteriovorax sp. DPLXC-1]|uniref:helix-turn-helix domain-containing protein n=1 Tax=Halobacteriovorax sp. DPLXC-1 TaxID=3110771 RepID=UPI002FF0B04B
MIGQILRYIRNFHKVSLTELSEEFEISQGYLSDIERGVKKPSLEIIDLYSTKFNIPSSGILFFSENSDDPKQLKKLRTFIGKRALDILDYVNHHR